MYIYIPISPPSCVSLPPSLSHPSMWSQSTELLSLCYAAASHQLPILHLVVYICQCHSLTSSQLTLPPPHVLNSILYIYIFIPVLPLGSSELFFFQFHIYALVYGICFSLSAKAMQWRKDSLSTNDTEAIGHPQANKGMNELVNE